MIPKSIGAPPSSRAAPPMLRRRPPPRPGAAAPLVHAPAAGTRLPSVVGRRMIPAAPFMASRCRRCSLRARRVSRRQFEEATPEPLWGMGGPSEPSPERAYGDRRAMQARLGSCVVRRPATGVSRRPVRARAGRGGRNACWASARITLDMASLRVGVVGSRFAARLHVAAYRRAYGVEARLAGVTSPTAERREAFARETGATPYPSLAAMLPHVDVVDVCAPPAHHEPVALEAIEAGRHVVIEKPFTGAFGRDGLRRPPGSKDALLKEALASAGRIVSAARRRGVVLGYAENWIYAPASRRSARSSRRRARRSSGCSAASRTAAPTRRSTASGATPAAARWSARAAIRCRPASISSRSKGARAAARRSGRPRSPAACTRSPACPATRTAASCAPTTTTSRTTASCTSSSRTAPSPMSSPPSSCWAACTTGSTCSRTITAPRAG